MPTWRLHIVWISSDANSATEYVVSGSYRKKLTGSVAAGVVAIGFVYLNIGALLVGVFPEPTAAQGASDAQFTAEGTERCLNCHGGERMVLMAESSHGNLDNPHTPFAKQGCESCHGPGSLHVSRARGGAGFPPLAAFEDDESLRQQTQVCIDCHANGMGELEGMQWVGSLHDTDDVTCVSCHEAHVVGDALTDQKLQRDSCSTCHDEQIASHNLFENRGIVFDRLACYDCHDVHQLTRER